MCVCRTIIAAVLEARYKSTPLPTMFTLFWPPWPGHPSTQQQSKVVCSWNDRETETTYPAFHTPGISHGEPLTFRSARLCQRDNRLEDRKPTGIQTDTLLASCPKCSHMCTFDRMLYYEWICGGEHTVNNCETDCKCQGKWIGCRQFIVLLLPVLMLYVECHSHVTVGRRNNFMKRINQDIYIYFLSVWHLYLYCLHAHV